MTLIIICLANTVKTLWVIQKAALISYISQELLCVLVTELESSFLIFRETNHLNDQVPAVHLHHEALSAVLLSEVFWAGLILVRQ